MSPFLTSSSGYGTHENTKDRGRGRGRGGGGSVASALEIAAGSASSIPDDLERAAPASSAALKDPDSISAHGGNLVTSAEERNLKRGLHERHLAMLGIAGAIGTGLFLGLGGAIQSGGPLGALLGYGTVGLVVSAVQFALGEISALLPVTGSFVRHAELLFDPAWSFAIGWNLVYGNLLSIPSEISAICVLFEFWTDINPSVWIILFIMLTLAIGFSLVAIFGEVEYYFSWLKILLVVFLIILGLVIALGGVPGTPAVYFKYWKNPGAFATATWGDSNWGKFLGYWSVMTNAVFSFAGIESLAMAGAETTNPRKAIPRACRNVFIRILLFYILAILVVGMLVKSTDPGLNDSSGTAAQSPFVIVASAAGLPAIASIVNAIVITSAWSSSNQALLAGTRVLYGLALKGQAPRIFLKTTSWGVPYACVCLFGLFSFLAFLSLSDTALTAFYWLLDLTAAGVLVSWISIVFLHIRLREAMKVQGVPYTRLPWHNSWTLYSSYAALFMCIIILLTGGFEVFTRGNWSASNFVSAYLDIPLVLTAYLIWKFVKKTKVIPLSEIPLDEFFAIAEQHDEASNLSGK